MKKTISLLLVLLCLSASAQTDVTNLITNPDFEINGRDGWTTNAFQIASNNNFALNHNGHYAEIWTSSGTARDAYLYQDITDMPVGTYTLTALAHNIKQSDMDRICTGAYIIANDARTSFNVDSTYSVTCVVTEGTLRIGAQTEGCTGNYVCVDNFQLFYELNIDDVRGKIQELVDEMTSIDQKDNTAARDELIAAQNGLKAYLTGDNTDGLTEAFTRAHQALNAYRLSIASTNFPYDMTDRVVNASFEEGHTGWEWSELKPQSNKAFGSTVGAYYVEKWTWGANVGNGYVRQVVKDLPNGRYRLTALATNQRQDNTGASQTGAYIVGEDQMTAVSAEKLYSVEFISISGEATIGFNASNATGNWICVDDFHLYYLGSAPESELKCLQDMIKSGQTYAQKKMDAQLLSNLNAAIDKAKLITSSEGMKDAAATLKSAIAAAVENIPVYEQLANAIKEAQSALSKGGALGKDEFQSTIDKAQALYNGDKLTWDQTNAMKKELTNAAFSYKIANGSGTEPKVTTHPVVISGCKAAVGRLTASGSNIIERGFCWATNPDPKVTDNRSSFYYDYGGPCYLMSDLEPSTEYWVRAYALTSTYAVGYGEPVHVMMLPAGDTQYGYAWNGDDEQNERIDNALKVATEYFNNWTAIQGFRPWCNFSAGTETANCGYGGGMSMGPGPQYQTPGTVLHELGHGVGIGTHWRYYEVPSDLHLADYTWDGERGNRVTNFFEPGKKCDGDKVHVCFGINGGGGGPIDYIRCVALYQAMYEDGLPAVGDGACPFYSFEEKAGEKYYLTNDRYNRHAKYLCVKDGILQYLPVTSNAAMKADDSFAWYITYDKESAFYRFQNVKTGKYFSFTGDGSGMTVTDSKGASTHNGITYGSAEQIHLMPARINTDMTTEGGSAFQAKPYWIARSNRSWQPEVMAVGSVKSNKVLSSKQDFSNNAKPQFWYILSADQLPATAEVGTRKEPLGQPWQKLTEMPDNMGNYFYAIYDNRNEDTQLGMKLGYGEHNGNQTMVYTQDIQPASDKKCVWAMEPFKKEGNQHNATGNTADCFILSNVGQPNDLLHSGEAWYYRVENNCQGWPDRGYIIPSNETADDEWMLWNNKGSYVGPWNDYSFLSGNEVAGNKSTDKAGLFSIYAISRGQYMQMVEDVASASGNNPINVTYLIRNADARWRNSNHDHFPIGWTVKEGSTTDAQSIFKVKPDYDMSGRSKDNYIFEAWQSSGNLSNRSISQTLTDLPNGNYMLSITTDNTTSGVYLFANTTTKSMDQSGTTKLLVSVTDGTLKFGVELNNYQGNWLRFDNFQLQFIGNDTEIDPSAVQKVLEDGTYYLYNNEKKGFLGRGYPYGTGVVVGEYGAAVKISTDDSGDSQLRFFDSKLQFVYDSGWTYSDSGNNSYFTVSEADGGYKFLCHSGKQGYLATWTDADYERVVSDGPEDRASAVWSVMTVDEYLSYIQKYDAEKGLQAVKVTDDRLGDLSTLSWYFDEEDVTLSDATDLIESYQEYCNSDWNAAPYVKLEKTVNNLPAGLYRLSVYAFERASWFDDVVKADGARGACYIEVNDVKVNVKSIMEESSITKHSGSNSEHDGKYYPNDITSAKDAFAKGMYENHVYVYLPEDGSVTYKMVVPNRLGNDGSRARWLIFQNFKLAQLVPIIDGDVNCDGRVDIEDIETLSSALLNKSNNAVHPDVNRDGKVSISDQTSLIEIVGK